VDVDLGKPAITLQSLPLKLGDKPGDGIRAGCTGR
jgi:hypothetical protein